MLAAPTGRAAKRMSETTGYEARTIHRMLELNGGMEGNAGFERNEQNPLETNLIIIDEMSMVDISLMNSLLKAILPGTRLILVGDVNQLPSVGAGSVLKDIIDSKMFPTVMLTKIFRQASTSDIIVNAHKINRGEAVSLDNKSMDFFFLKRYEADKRIRYPGAYAYAERAARSRTSQYDSADVSESAIGQKKGERAWGDRFPGRR